MPVVTFTADEAELLSALLRATIKDLASVDDLPIAGAARAWVANRIEELIKKIEGAVGSGCAAPIQPAPIDDPPRLPPVEDVTRIVSVTARLPDRIEAPEPPANPVFTSDVVTKLAARPTPASAPAPEQPVTQKTPERVALMRRLVTEQKSNRDIQVALNLLPGGYVAIDRISAYKTQWAAPTPNGTRLADVVRPPAPPAVPGPAAHTAAPLAKAVDGVANGLRHEVVDRYTAVSWGAERGIPGPKLDLPTINARRRSLGLSQFVVEG